MKLLTVISSILLLFLLVSCFPIAKEPNIVGINNNTDLIAQFAFKNKVYSIEGNQTPQEKISEKLGKIKEVGEIVRENGQLKLYKPHEDITDELTIYKIKDVNKDDVLALKAGDTYYTAIFAYHLK